MSDQTIGDLIDARGVKADIGPNELVSDCLVVMKVHSDEHGTYVKAAFSDGMDWITRRGLLEVARDAEAFDQDESEEG